MIRMFGNRYVTVPAPSGGPQVVRTLVVPFAGSVYRASQGIAQGTTYDYTSGSGAVNVPFYIGRFTKGFGTLLQEKDLIADAAIQGLAIVPDHTGAIAYKADVNEVWVGLLRNTGGCGYIARLDGDTLAVKGVINTVSLNINASSIDPVAIDTVSAGGPYVWYGSPSFVFRSPLSGETPSNPDRTWAVSGTWGFSQGMRILPNGNLLTTFPFATGGSYLPGLYEMDISVPGTFTPVHRWDLAVIPGLHLEGIDLVSATEIWHAEGTQVSKYTIFNLMS